MINHKNLILDNSQLTSEYFYILNFGIFLYSNFKKVTSKAVQFFAYKGVIKLR